MKVNIQINTTQETRSFYKDEVNKKDWTTIFLNPSDETNQSQRIGFDLTGFNYKGSLQPLEKLISDWIEQKVVEQVSIDQQETLEKIRKSRKKA